MGEMNTYCMIYKLKEDKIKEYIECHKNLPQKQVNVLRECGAQNLEIFLWKNYAIITYECEDFNELLENLTASEENSEWQKIVSPMFAKTPSFEGKGKITPLEKMFSLKSSINNPRFEE
jgi:L-rhamnose mutarotase